MGAAPRCEPVPGSHWRTGSPGRVYDSTSGQEHARRTTDRACAAAADRTGLEAAAIGGNPYPPLDPGLEFGDERVAQTDRPGFIVSSLTINAFYLHDLPLPVCVSLQKDSSIAAAVRLPGRDAHSPLSGAVCHWTSPNGRNFVFGHVVTVDLWLSTSGVIVIAHRHLPILPWPQGKEHTARRESDPGGKVFRGGRAVERYCTIMGSP